MNQRLRSQLKRAALTLAFGMPMLAATNHALAQKCHYDKSKQDAFSSETTRAITSKIGPNTIDGKKNYMVGWTSTVEETGGKYYISFTVILFGKYSELFSEGQKMLLKLENGKIVELTAAKDVVPVYMTADAVYTHYDLKFELDAETLTSLSKQYVTNIKLTTGNQSIAAELSEKHSDRLMSAAACILKKEQQD